ncbi:hypothetical protein RhiirA4_469796 [Rhizophagus irregularis]|uniref:Uncharacterized protein n=1 Tax=Rhizophagus irregularis TaxID=588596 RepID=A0A2I1H050_9GLOM|nr:hypothetical protein RhiirA4_469796 [Rhizophagus irregularis]
MNYSDENGKNSNNQNTFTITIFTVDDAIHEHKSKNGSKRSEIHVEIFKETADKGNPSAQLRYGIQSNLYVPISIHGY